MTFAGSSGQQLQFQTSGSTYPSAPQISLTRSGSTVMSWNGNKLTGVLTLSSSGTYTIMVDPQARDAGSIAVKAWLVPADADAGTLIVDGAQKPVANTAGAQNAFIRFAASSGETIKITTSGSTFSMAPVVELKRPNGQVLFTRGGEFTSKAITLPAPGTYTIYVDPKARDVGSIKVKVFQP